MDKLLGGNLLVIGAHADDIDIGCGGTIRKLKSSGASVTGLIVTDTHYVRGDTVHRDSEISRLQAMNAAEIIGYDVYFGNERNNDVNVNSKLVYLIRDYIEKFNINTIFTHWDGDAHLDHRNVATATIMASRDPRNLIMYRTNFYISTTAFSPNLLVDTSDYIDLKIQALNCYETELKRCGADYFDWIKHANRVSGATANCGYAEEFKIVKYYNT